MPRSVEYKTELDVSVEALCNQCGAVISIEADGQLGGSLTLYVDPCENCLSEAVAEVEYAGALEGAG